MWRVDQKQEYSHARNQQFKIAEDTYRRALGQRRKRRGRGGVFGFSTGTVSAPGFDPLDGSHPTVGTAATHGTRPPAPQSSRAVAGDTYGTRLLKALKLYHTWMAPFFRDVRDPFTRARRFGLWFVSIMLFLGLSSVLYLGESVTPLGIPSPPLAGLLVAVVVSFLVVPVLTQLFAQSASSSGSRAHLPYAEVASWWDILRIQFLYGARFKLPSLVTTDPYERYFADYAENLPCVPDPNWLGTDWQAGDPGHPDAIGLPPVTPESPPAGRAVRGRADAVGDPGTYGS